MKAAVGSLGPLPKKAKGKVHVVSVHRTTFDVSYEFMNDKLKKLCEKCSLLPSLKANALPGPQVQAAGAAPLHLDGRLQRRARHDVIGTALGDAWNFHGRYGAASACPSPRAVSRSRQALGLFAEFQSLGADSQSFRAVRRRCGFRRILRNVRDGNPVDRD